MAERMGHGQEGEVWERNIWDQGMKSRLEEVDLGGITGSYPLFPLPPIVFSSGRFYYTAQITLEPVTSEFSSMGICTVCNDG